MESIDPLWVFGGIALLAGGLLGALICRRFTPTISDVDELRVKLERSRSEMETYRASVNSHFSKTSDLVKDLTEDYVKRKTLATHPNSPTFWNSKRAGC